MGKNPREAMTGDSTKVFGILGVVAAKEEAEKPLFETKKFQAFSAGYTVEELEKKFLPSGRRVKDFEEKLSDLGYSLKKPSIDCRPGWHIMDVDIYSNDGKNVGAYRVKYKGRKDGPDDRFFGNVLVDDPELEKVLQNMGWFKQTTKTYVIGKNLSKDLISGKSELSTLFRQQPLEDPIRARGSNPFYSL